MMFRYEPKQGAASADDATWFKIMSDETCMKAGWCWSFDEAMMQFIAPLDIFVHSMNTTLKISLLTGDSSECFSSPTHQPLSPISHHSRATNPKRPHRLSSLPSSPSSLLSP